MKRFTARDGNVGFRCAQCGTEVLPLANGSLRDHCPSCLWSLHLDVNPGDRASTCGAPLEPVGVVAHRKRGWQIVYRCTGCGEERRNAAALDDPQQPDDLDRIIALSTTARSSGQER